jgi:hypothetical protein
LPSGRFSRAAAGLFKAALAFRFFGGGGGISALSFALRVAVSFVFRVFRVFCFGGGGINAFSSMSEPLSPATGLKNFCTFGLSNESDLFASTVVLSASSTKRSMPHTCMPRTNCSHCSNTYDLAHTISLIFLSSNFSRYSVCS